MALVYSVVKSLALHNIILYYKPLSVLLEIDPNQVLDSSISVSSVIAVALPSFA